MIFVLLSSREIVDINKIETVNLPRIEPWQKKSKNKSFSDLRVFFIIVSETQDDDSIKHHKSVFGFPRKHAPSICGLGESNSDRKPKNVESEKLPVINK